MLSENCWKTSENALSLDILVHRILRRYFSGCRNVKIWENNDKLNSINMNGKYFFNDFVGPAS